MRATGSVSAGASVYDLWFALFPSLDAPDRWVAHCLQIDVMGEGNSPTGALDSLATSCAGVIRVETATKKNPFLLRAPAPCWNAIWQVACSPHAKPASLETEERKAVLVGQMSLVVDSNERGSPDFAVLILVEGPSAEGDGSSFDRWRTRYSESSSKIRVSKVVR
jgi:hypothetical protein